MSTPRLGPDEAARQPRAIHDGTPQPWTSGDVKWQARGCGYPATLFRGRMIEGEKQWSAALAAATPSEVQALHAALARVEAPPSRRAASTSVQLPDPRDDYDYHHRIAMTDNEFHVLVDVLRHVQDRCGLRLPVPVHFEFTDEDMHPPGTQGLTYDRRRPVVILLRSGLGIRDLFAVACHELQHAADAGLNLSREEGERRACAFQVMAARQAGFAL